MTHCDICNTPLVDEVRRFQELVETTSQPDWDDEGAGVIGPPQWDVARRLAETVAIEVPRAPEVFFSACGDGEVHLSWANATRSINAELGKNEVRWATEGPEGHTWVQGKRVPDLIQALRALFA